MNDGDYQKLKIGYLTERMILGFGVDLVVHETARRFAESGHDVTVFTTKKSDLYVDESYKIVDLTETVVVNQDIFSPHFMVECINQLSHCDIDVWIAQTPPFYSWLTFLRPPVILVEHGTPPGKFFKGKMARDLDTMTAHRYNVIYSTLRPGDTVVAISEFIRSGLPENVSRNAITILNGGDHYPRTTENAKVTFRKTIGLSENDIMLLWVGRIDPFVDYQPYKGLQEFLEVSPIIRKKYPHCKIVAVGRAEERARKPLEDAGIIPVFNLGKDTMPSAYAAADIFINTSRWEGFNLPLIEAQFQGTP
ncbi:glycosyltransferase family 4 protein, partial [bacterium]|nr:glycosyltransferase family 4 protein [candidate division CSSED10-310 bacterium]